MKLKLRYCNMCKHETLQVVSKVIVFYKSTPEVRVPVSKSPEYDGDDVHKENLWLCPTCGTYRKITKSSREEIVTGEGK